MRGPYGEPRASPWARFVFNLAVRRRPWSLDEHGVLSLASAAPAVVGGRVLFHERGVCGSCWQTDGLDCWIYPFASELAARTWLEHWTNKQEEGYAPYMEHWIRSCEKRTRGRRLAEALAYRYSH